MVPCESKDLALVEVRLVFMGDEVFSFEGIFCCGEVMLDAEVVVIALVFLMPNIDEKAALIVFLVFLASCPKTCKDFAL